MIAGVECAKGMEKEFNDWYNSTFPAIMMKAPGVIRVDRYERVEDDDRLPKFLSVVQLENEAAIDEMARSDALRQIASLYVEEGARWDLKVRWALHYRSIYASES